MRAILLVLVGLLVPASACADVVGPDPTDCPVGSRGTSCHGMEYCTPRTCTATSGCATGEICQARDLCISSGSCGGLRPPDASPPPPVSIVTAICDGACAEGSCESRMVCVPDGTPPGTGSSDGGCGCHVAQPKRSGLWFGGLAALALLVAKRRLSSR